jgi:hypothetical protein
MISKVGRLVDLQVQLWILVSQTASRQSHGSQEEKKGGEKSFQVPMPKCTTC